ncbi:MAG TPA: hypothetical protein VMQ17_08765 [Candidatus Sulfotelmatobacter sp.]|nr:hypothetical protein [Candidatus Sulfotelmatobacter sp.]
MKKRISLWLVAAALLFSFEVWVLIPPASVHAQVTPTPGVVTIQATIGAGTNTQITTTDTPCSELYLQNNAAHNMRVGGAATTSSKGAQLTTVTGGGGGSLTANGFGFRGTNANQWFVAGTNGDVVDVICIQ